MTKAQEMELVKRTVDSLNLSPEVNEIMFQLQCREQWNMMANVLFQKHKPVFDKIHLSNKKVFTHLVKLFKLGKKDREYKKGLEEIMKCCTHIYDYETGVLKETGIYGAGSSRSPEIDEQVRTWAAAEEN